MDRIGPDSSGLYVVRTGTAEYMLDLDGGTATRYRSAGGSGEGLLPPAHLRRDGEELRLVAVVRCEVGRAMQLLLVVSEATAPLTWRMTTPVRSITRLR